MQEEFEVEEYFGIELQAAEGEVSNAHETGSIGICPTYIQNSETDTILQSASWTSEFIAMVWKYRFWII